MGGCVSRPKESDMNEGPDPAEVPEAASKQPEAATQEKVSGGENKTNDAPVVEVSEHKKEAEAKDEANEQAVPAVTVAQEAQSAPAASDEKVERPAEAVPRASKAAEAPVAEKPVEAATEETPAEQPKANTEEEKPKVASNVDQDKKEAVPLVNV